MVEKKPCMFILTGISFAGKSTLGREIAKDAELEMIDLNAVTKEIDLAEQASYISPKQFAIAHQEAEKKAKEILQKGKSIVYDATPFTKEKRDQLRQLAASCDAETLLIYVQASITLAFKRWQESKSDPGRHIVTHIDNFMWIVDHFEPPENEEHIIFNAGEDIGKWIKTNIQINTLP